ncbi:MAG: NUDIX domain-containing protein [Bacilli bacterium]|nr:NUDIX domain-containing protein [Bacilli bacterium]
MELVDLYDSQKELTGETVDKKEVPEGKFRLSVHVWITNDQGELLLQQRLATAHKFPNMWSVTGGAVQAGESSLDGVLRELSEELGIKADKEEMKFLASYRRKFDYVDVWLLNRNIDVKNIKMQEDEVQAVKWVTMEEFEKMLENKKVIRSSYDYYKLYIKPIF